MAVHRDELISLFAVPSADRRSPGDASAALPEGNRTGVRRLAQARPSKPALPRFLFSQKHLLE
jgi:hypothetical protein